MGERRLKEIEPVELLTTLRKVEERGAVETADRGLMLARQVWRYGVATGRVERDVTADLKGALSPYRKRGLADVPSGCELALIEVNDFLLVSLRMSWQESMKALFRQQAKAIPRRSSYFDTSFSS